MTLIQGWTEGKASQCQNLECTTVTGGIGECKKRCLDNPDCTLINFCPAGADCTSGLNRCCLRKCNNDDYQLTNQWKGWDIYVKSKSSIHFKYLKVFNV